MPSLTIRSSNKTVVVSYRSARSMSSATETRGNPGAISTKRLRLLWRRKRIVIPAGTRSLAGDQRVTIAEAQTPVMPLHADEEQNPNDKIVFLNNPTEFDLRFYFFRRPKSAMATDRLERSAISQSSVSRRSITREFTSANSNKREIMTFGTKSEFTSPTAEALAARQARKPRRRLRAKEELCIVLPRSTTRGRTRSQKSWFLGPGFIGREAGEGTFVVTKEKSMDPVHAEISVSGDDFFVRDAQSTMGTFLCLNTRYRHYPQRDGFRLHPGDVFRIGPSTSIRVLDLQTTVTAPLIREKDKSRSSSSSSLVSATEKKIGYRNTQDPKLERSPSTESTTLKPTLKRMSTVEELRLLAADIEDELMNDVGRNHSSYETHQEEARKNSIIKDTSQVRKPSTTSKPRHAVHFSDTPPVMSDGSVFLGSRYIWPEVKELHYHEPSQVEDADDDMIKQLVGSENEPHPLDPGSENTNERRPLLVRLVIFQHDPSNATTEPQKSREVTLPGQNTYLIGSSAACDVRIFPSEGIEIRAVHTRIVFDGASFVLQDLSFERDPRRQTRVLLSQRPARVTRGDWLMLGKCSLYITTTVRAFGSERRPDIKEAAMRLDVLRLSKRKPRTRGLFVPVGFRLHSASGSGASSGSNGWGGSSGGPVTFGKGRDCDAQVFTASLATEQFSVQLERGTCLLTPKPTGINAGTYFLIGRDESGPQVLDNAIGGAGEGAGAVEVVKHTSKPLLLSEGCVFRCGGSELEVIYSKSVSAREVKSSTAIEEQQHIQFLSAMPWLKPISSDVTLVANVARCGQRLKLSTGDLIYEKGDAANFVFIVITGEIALQIIVGNDHSDDNEDILTERVAAGGFFGEVSLQDPSEVCASTPHTDDLEYPETARAASSCELLALAREDVCGYLGLYLDVIRAHLRQDRCRDRIIRVACSYVPWLRGISLQEIRMLSAHAEVAVYPPGSTLFEDGKLFVPATFAAGNTFQLRDGILVLSRGNARVVRSKREREQRKSMEAYHADDLDDTHHILEHVHDVDDEAEEPNEWWSAREPVIAMSSSSSPSVLSFCDLSFRLEAYSTVECYFVAAVHLAHLNVGKTAKQQKIDSVETGAPTAAQIPPPIKRGNSLHVVTRRMHHSQVVTSALHSGDSSTEDEDQHSLDGSDGEGDTTAARRWRRKKRNKQLLEQTVLETRNDAHIPNALVLYVLAGAQRGDIHVVRNVASIGGLLSGADIELNDRYVSRAHAVIEYHEGKYWLYDNGSKWGTFVRLEEDNAVDINPGDVFLAGEVEFTCLASYPERNKPSMCCVM